MELVSRNGIVLANEVDLRGDGFHCQEECVLRVNIPTFSPTKTEKEYFFFFDKDYNLIEKHSPLLLQPDEEVFLFRCQISLYNNRHISGVDFSYKRISFEIDNDTSTYFIVGSLEFIKTSKEIEKKVEKKVKILV